MILVVHAPGVVKTRYKRLQFAWPKPVEAAIILTVALACLSALIDLAQFMGVIG